MRSSKSSQNEGTNYLQQLQSDFARCQRRKVLLTIVASRLSNHYETEGLLPQEQRGFRFAQKTIAFIFVVRRFQELGRQAKFHSKCSSSICRTRMTLWTESSCRRYPNALACQARCLHLSSISMEACGLACVQMTVSTRKSFMSRRGCG